MIKEIFVIAFMIAYVDCEPPVSYLPPGNGAPSQSYGPPGFQPGSPIGADQLGSTGGNGKVPPSTSYGVPNGQISTPMNGNGKLRNGHSNGNGINGNGHSNGKMNGRPNASYGPPGEGGNVEERLGGLGGSAGTSNVIGDGGSAEDTGPAKYEFEWKVSDAESGNEFGQKEERDGDKVIGQYNVLMADGRMQIVEYEADEEGYRPQISYEGTAVDGGAGGSGGSHAGGGGSSESRSGTSGGYTDGMNGVGGGAGGGYPDSGAPKNGNGIGGHSNGGSNGVDGHTNGRSNGNGGYRY